MNRMLTDPRPELHWLQTAVGQATRFAIATTWLVHGWLAQPVAIGDTVWLRDPQAVPLFGRIVGVDEKAISLAVAREGVNETLEIPRADVLAWHEVIDEPRLEALWHVRHEEYLALAIELSAFRWDPSARQLARELAQIALGLSAGAGDKATGRRAWLLLYSELEESEQRERCLAAGRQLGLVASPRSDRESGTASGIEAPVSEAHREQLLDVVRGLRRGRPGPSQLPEAELQSMLQPWHHLVTAEELNAWRAAEQLSHADLLQLLKLEMALEHAGPPELADPDDWAILARLEPVPIAAPREAVMAITGFDPLRSFWRKGEWLMAPSDPGNPSGE